MCYSCVLNNDFDEFLEFAACMIGQICLVFVSFRPNKISNCCACINDAVPVSNCVNLDNTSVTCCWCWRVNRITYWSHGVASLPLKCQPPSPLLDNIRVHHHHRHPRISSRRKSWTKLQGRVMVIVWRLRGNIIRTTPCWVVWHSVYSQQHTHVSSSYRSSRLGSHIGTLTPCIEAVA